MMTAGGKQNMTIINESGLYSLVLCSNLTDAQKTYLIGRQYEAQKMSRGTSGGFRGNQYENVVKVQNGPLPQAEDTAQKVARDIGRFSVSIRVMELKSRNRHRAG